MPFPGISKIEIDCIRATVRINLSPAPVSFGLLFRAQARCVIDIMAEDLVAIVAIFFGMENVLMPEFVYLFRRRRDCVFTSLMGKRIKESPVFEFHLVRVF